MKVTAADLPTDKLGHAAREWLNTAGIPVQPGVWSVEPILLDMPAYRVEFLTDDWDDDADFPELIVKDFPAIVELPEWWPTGAAPA